MFERAVGTLLTCSERVVPARLPISFLITLTIRIRRWRIKVIPPLTLLAFALPFALVTLGPSTRVLGISLRIGISGLLGIGILLGWRVGFSFTFRIGFPFNTRDGFGRNRQSLEQSITIVLQNPPLNITFNLAIQIFVILIRGANRDTFIFVDEGLEKRVGLFDFLKECRLHKRRRTVLIIHLGPDHRPVLQETLNAIITAPRNTEKILLRIKTVPQASAVRLMNQQQQLTTHERNTVPIVCLSIPINHSDNTIMATILFTGQDSSNCSGQFCIQTDEWFSRDRKRT